MYDRHTRRFERMSSFGTIGMIGYGAIGAEIEGALDRLGERDRLVATLVREGRTAPEAVHTAEGLLAAKPGVAIECAGHQAVRDYVPALLASGVDCIVSSIGVLADPKVAEALSTAERAGT
jgi:aspartate dehydrogenase